MSENVLRIAKVCHEANRAYCASLGDDSQLPWDEAPEWQRESAIAGAKWRIENPSAPDSSQHEQWMKDKSADGWVFGEVKDPDRKTHPCLVPFEELPTDQQRKDKLFSAIVKSLSE